MAKFILIGGGEVGRGTTSYETKEIDEEVVRLAAKEKPKFLFVGLASSFSDSYYDTMKKIYQALGCECAYLKNKNLKNNRALAIKKIEVADIIYFCGGDTIQLMERITEHELEPIFRKKIKEDTVFVGMSAGAILFCKEGYSDAKKLRGEAEDYTWIKGLGFLDFSFCPHYGPSKERKMSLINNLKNTNKKVLAVEDGIALKIEQKIEQIKAKDANAYTCYYEEETYQEELLTN